MLGLEKIEAIHIRAEDLAKKGNRYDIVTARAVANLSKLLSWTMPLVKKDGSFHRYERKCIRRIKYRHSYN